MGVKFQKNKKKKQSKNCMKTNMNIFDQSIIKNGETVTKIEGPTDSRLMMTSKNQKLPRLMRSVIDGSV